jgi:hypothetical protein
VSDLHRAATVNVVPDETGVAERLWEHLQEVADLDRGEPVPVPVPVSRR